MELSQVTWRKSSRSGSNGGECVEVGVWQKSSYSNANGGNCVEVSATRDLNGAEPGVLCLVRDSKDRDGGCLAFGAAEWAAFVRRVQAAP